MSENIIEATQNVKIKPHTNTDKKHLVTDETTSYKSKIEAQLNDIKIEQGYTKFADTNPILERGKMALKKVGYNV